VTPLPKFVVLYAAMYAAYGVASPFLPSLLASRGMTPEEIGFTLGAATAVRLVSAPLAGRIGDRVQALRVVLAVSISVAALATLGFLSARQFGVLFAVILAHAAALAPMTVLADALALGAANRAPGFEYGWVRGTGSAAFILATLAAGQAVSATGLDAILWAQALLLAVAAFAAIRVPELVPKQRGAPPPRGVGVLLRLPVFRNLVLAAALVLGSHAMHDAFAVIRWTEAGIGAVTASVLWSEAVAAEVIVFFFIGPALVARLTPAGAIAVAAAAGALRWGVMAQTTEVFVLALVQPLHGATFALLHLACMRLIARSVPDGLEGTAQALYATIGVGAATALLTALSGGLFARFGPQAFWLMALLCACAWPLAWKLRRA
jgi:MFS transporter, PPP family, 3-phenylpropionic acid transporter